MFYHGKLHTLVIQSSTLLGSFLQTWTGKYSIDEVCNFPSQNMTVNEIIFLEKNKTRLFAVKK